jgi:dTDP-4-dehydrorhamnose 3,5-epimerase
MIEGVIITPLKIIDVPGGDVLQAMKVGDTGFSEFGEAYFSTVEPGYVKAWKRHHKMTLNLIVPVGKIRFIIFDDRKSDNGQYQEAVLSKENYCRLTIPPMVWIGFQGVDKNISILLNIADIEHVPEECDRKVINQIKYDWELNK